MRAKKKETPAVAETVEASREDVVVLAAAYQAGLIQAWKRDPARGYCLTRVGRADEYVDVDKLTGYLKKLSNAA